MENFFKWIGKIIPKEEVIIWFNVHNMTYEKIELYGDIFKSIAYIIYDTYLGEENSETRIILTKEDNEAHFNWCWKKLVEDFKKEKVNIKEDGAHKNYLQKFFLDTFYNQKDKEVKEEVPMFMKEVFDVEKDFSKADLDILTELYKFMEHNIQ